MSNATTATVKRSPLARAIGARRFYAVSSGILPTCGKLGYRLLPCPTCGTALPIGPAMYFVSIPGFFKDRRCGFDNACRGDECPLCDEQIARHVSARAPYRAGLVWAPLARYPTGRAFARAIGTIGTTPIAWPMKKLPAALVAGSTPILVGHAKGIIDADGSTSPSIMAIFIPSEIVYVPGPMDQAPYLRRLRRLGVELRETAPDGVP